MQQFDNPNRQYPESAFKRFTTEIPIGIWKYRRTNKLKEERANESLENMQSLLLRVKDQLDEDTPYFTQDDIPQIKEHLGTGFFASAYSFESNTGNWVIKVGASHSPMRSYFNPNTQEFAEWYQGCLDIQRQTFSEHLPFLIPEPQTIVHLQGGQGERTAIIQPLVTDILTNEQIQTLSKENKAKLITEYKIFLEISKQLDKGFGLVPDFELKLGLIRRDTSHFVISQQHGKPHLVMLDTAPFDKESPTPIFYQLNKLAGHSLIHSEQRKLRKKD